MKSEVIAIRSGVGCFILGVLLAVLGLLKPVVPSLGFVNRQACIFLAAVMMVLALLTNIYAGME